MTATRNWRLEGYAPDAKAAIAGAQALADERSHAEADSLHLLFRLLDRDPWTQKVFEAAGVDPGETLVETEAVLRKIPQVPGAIAYLSPRMLQLTTRAEAEATREAVPVRVRHLLIGLVSEVAGLAGAVLRSLDVDEARFRGALKAVAEPPPGAEAGYAAPSEARASGGAGATPADGNALQRYTRDLLLEASQDRFDPIVGRDGELRWLLQVLARRQKNNPLLVGEPGVGKRAIAYALATRLVRGDVPAPLKKKRVMQLDLGLLVAGARLRGELEDRLRQVLAAAAEADGDVVLFVDELHTLFGSTSVGSGPADLLKPALARGEVQVLGTTTPAEYKKNIEKDSALSRLFAAIPIEPPSLDEAIAMCRGVVERYEVHHGVKISDPGVLAAVKLTKRYIPSRELPDKAIDVMDEAAAQTRLALDAGPWELDSMARRVSALEAQHRSLIDEEDGPSVEHRTVVEAELQKVRGEYNALNARWERQRTALARVRVAKEKLLNLRGERDKAARAGDTAAASRLTTDEIPVLEKELSEAERALALEEPLLLRTSVGEESIGRVIEQWTGVPVAKMLESETARLLKMEDHLRGRVVGQDLAVTLISKCVRRGRVGLRDPGRPVGSFLFLGPTGVGKTELAKALAEFLFDDEQSMIRLDMSEFMEKGSLWRLIGSPTGYVDSESGGMLTEAVRRRPYSVVLFDEIEKAHTDIFNILLQVLDDGRLSDNRGQLADFSNTVIILTSNVGAPRILAATEEGLSDEALREEVQGELKRHFRPEFLNRIDDVCIFDRLSKVALRGIVDIQLKRLSRLLSESRVSLQVTPAARDLLTDLGYDPAFGARPLKRVILKQLQDPLAEELLKGGYKPKDVVEVDVGDEGFAFKKVL
ncbi:MAG: AAA family ATPase [Deltaproteobacteria bacterium]|nr:AAA family ATPase [Deltaproteobacteria bacterium]